MEEARDLGREISRGMVTLMKRYVGRGPTHARTYLEDSLVVTLLEDTMTQAERTLAGDQEEETVRELRRVFQHGSFRDEAIELVEGIVGRTVLAFLSDHAVEPDYAVEVFVLQSEHGSREGAERAVTEGTAAA
jgi:uncharacterized protein YbcI